VGGLYVLLKMKRLHTSYSNLGSWRTIHNIPSGVVRVLFDQRRGIYTSIVLFILALVAAIWLSGLKVNTENNNLRITGVWILMITGVAVPLIILLYGWFQTRKGDYIRYDTSHNILNLPHIDQSIERAKERCYFSSEHFTDNSDHFFELNLVLDGERLKFLSSSVANGFKPIIKTLQELGFSVNHQKIKM
jgi:hypothetical protein